MEQPLSKMQELSVKAKSSNITLKTVYLLGFILVLIIIFLVIGILIGKAVWESSSAKSEPQTQPTVAGWLQPYESELSKLVADITTGKNKGYSFEWLANVTSTYGPRLVGSENLEKAIDGTIAFLKSTGRFDNVHTEDVPRKELKILGIGNSPPADIFNADVIVVDSNETLFKLGEDGVRGKIVVFNQEWKGYIDTVKYRYTGVASELPFKLGAVAVLVRSLTGLSIHSPHTGAGSKNESLAIPAACLTVEDAEWLQRLYDQGQKLKMNFTMTSNSQGYVTSRNIIFDITGSEKPDEVVILSGHFDSWDVGTGAMDNAGGCAIALQALNAMATLGMEPKRTIRAIFFTAEEIGYLGSKHYYDTYKKSGKEKFVFLTNSDTGAFKPDSPNATLYLSKNGTANSGPEKKKLDDIRDFLLKFGIIFSTKQTKKNRGDIKFWEEGENAPGVYYVHNNKQEYYFYFHHSEGDTVSIFKDGDLDYSAAMFASIAWAFAQT